MPPKNRHVEVLRALWRQLPQGVRSRAQPVVRRVVPSDIRPVLSVVVPIYNVAEYLDECLQSICAQKIQQMEIILVDDGSTDSSRLIAETYAASDDRIVIVGKQNEGLGAARNTGIRHARGRFLMFADSDDVVPAGAYELLLGRIMRSGSDFVTGSVRRLAGTRLSGKPVTAGTHDVDRTGITVSVLPQAIHDVFAWNKMFRRSFWDRHVIGFPEGLVYEDKEPSVKAFLRAESFDTVSDVVYHWRIRADGSSISQQKQDMRDLRDRLYVAKQLQAVIEAEASTEVRNWWYAKELSRNLVFYYRLIPRTPAEYWEMLHEAVQSLNAAAGAEVWGLMTVQDRLLVHLIAAGHRSDVETVLTHWAEHGSVHPLRHTGGAMVAKPVFLPLLEHSVPPELLNVDVATLSLVTGLTSVRLISEGALELHGYAFIPGVPDDVTGGPELRIRSADGAVSAGLHVVSALDPELDNISGDPWISHQWAGFTARLEVGRLEERVAATQAGRWPELTLEVSLAVGSRTVAGPLVRRDRNHSPGILPLTSALHRKRYSPAFTSEGGMVLRAEPAVRIVPTLQCEGRAVDMIVQLPAGEVPVAVVADHKDHRAESDVVSLGDGIGRAHLRLPALPEPESNANPGKSRHWRVRVRTSHGKYHRLVWPHTSRELTTAPVAAGSLIPTTNIRGQLEIKEPLFLVLAAAVRFASGSNTLDVSGWIKADDIPRAAGSIETLVLINGGQKIKPQSCHIGIDGVFSAQFPLESKIWGKTANAPVPGNYALRYYRRDARGGAHAFPVAIDHDLEASLPLPIAAPCAAIQINRSSGSNLYVRIEAPLASGERGAVNQNLLGSGFRASSSRAVAPGTVFFESFAGRSVSDSGLDIYKQLGRRDDNRPMYWSICDNSVPVPTGTHGIVRYSRRWYELLATSEYVVTNGLLPIDFEKGNRQKLIQTWHGTPLKRIGRDGPNNHLNLAQLAALKQQARTWDLLLAQSQYAADTISGALGHRGDILTTGSPRNDPLVQPDAPVRRQQVRSRLGIEPHQRAVLYAPTWRDDVRDFRRPQGFVNYIDIDAAQHGLPDHYVLMLRSHQDMTGHKPETSDEFLIDVTSYPDIVDLYLAADVLVTDYSAVMFDFCNTSKPMIFLVPDLNKFLNGPRGCYLDFPSVAPGRLVTSTQELVVALLDDVADRELEQRRYQFRAEFAPHDDGKAARRVIDTVWGP